MLNERDWVIEQRTKHLAALLPPRAIDSNNAFRQEKPNLGIKPRLECLVGTHDFLFFENAEKKYHT